MHRIALETIEAHDAFDFVTIPESTRRVIRFHHAERVDPCADGGTDLPVPRSARRPRHPRRRAGTAGVCLEVTVLCRHSGAMPPGPRKARPDDRLSIGPESREPRERSLRLSGLTCARRLLQQEPCALMRFATASGFLALALLLIAPRAVAMDAVALPRCDGGCDGAGGLAAGDRRLSPQAAEYQEARGAFEQEASAYWNAIADKRRGRNAKRRDHQPITLDDYVLTQPPVYTGPKRPVNPAPEPAAGTPAARAQSHSGRRRSLEGRRRAIPVHAAAARQRTRIQARLCPGRLARRG